jgi:endonuclease/exonuclease/phosphatase family metal-dependent hydrolase
MLETQLNEQELRQILDKAQTDVVFVQEIDLINYCSQQLNLSNFKTYVHNGKKRAHVFLSEMAHLAMLLNFHKGTKRLRSG